MALMQLLFRVDAWLNADLQEDALIQILKRVPSEHQVSNVNKRWRRAKILADIQKLREQASDGSLFEIPGLRFVKATTIQSPKNVWITGFHTRGSFVSHWRYLLDLHFPENEDDLPTLKITTMHVSDEIGITSDPVSVPNSDAFQKIVLRSVKPDYAFARDLLARCDNHVEFQQRHSSGMLQRWNAQTPGERIMDVSDGKLGERISADTNGFSWNKSNRIWFTDNGEGNYDINYIHDGKNFPLNGSNIMTFGRLIHYMRHFIK